MKKTRIITTAALSIIAVVGALFVPIVNAVDDTTGSGQALEIAPPVLSLKANPGDVIDAKISLRDVSGSRLIVKGQVNDFVASGEDGTPKLLLEEGESSPYSLKGWIDPLPQLTLNSKEVQDLPVTIRVPANAAPGGYFAVVRFTATAPELDQTGVALSASLGALILLRVNGDATESMSVEEFIVSKNGQVTSLFESTPIDFIVRVNNAGNVHEQPTGQAVVKDMFGNTIGAVNVNLVGGNVLPKSVRKFSQPLDKSILGDRILFGRYTADLTMHYGSTNQTATSSVAFWIIPWKLILLVTAGLVGGFFLIRYGLRRYNQYVIKQARRRR